MASRNASMYQTDDLVSASIKADYPHAKYFSAKFSEHGFIVSAEG